MDWLDILRIGDAVQVRADGACEAGVVERSNFARIVVNGGSYSRLTGKEIDGNRSLAPVPRVTKVTHYYEVRQAKELSTPTRKRYRLIRRTVMTNLVGRKTVELSYHLGPDRWGAIEKAVIFISRFAADNVKESYESNLGVQSGGHPDGPGRG